MRRIDVLGYAGRGKGQKVVNMLRVVRTALATLSLILSVLLAGLWIRSNSFNEGVTAPLPRQGVLYISNSEGRIGVGGPNVPVYPWRRYSHTIKQERGAWRRATELFPTTSEQLNNAVDYFGFRWSYHPKRGDWNVAVPHWFAVPAFAVACFVFKPTPRLRYSLGDTLVVLTAVTIVLAGATVLAGKFEPF
jgi:hypothetical protein